MAMMNEDQREEIEPDRAQPVAKRIGSRNASTRYDSGRTFVIGRSQAGAFSILKKMPDRKSTGR